MLLFFFIYFPSLWKCIEDVYGLCNQFKLEKLGRFFETWGKKLKLNWGKNDVKSKTKPAKNLNLNLRHLWKPKPKPKTEKVLLKEKIKKNY